MAALQIDIMKIKQLLLLKSKNISNRRIASAIGIDRNTVNEYVKRLTAGGYTYHELLKLGEKDIQKLSPSKEALDKDRYIALHELFPLYLKNGIKSLRSWRRVVYKNEIKPWKKKGWIIPPLQNGDFVANMEKVLDVYMRPYNPNNPVICMDESPKQLIMETKDPIKMKPGREEKYDYEYWRNGVCNIFMANEPLTGKRYVGTFANNIIRR